MSTRMAKVLLLMAFVAAMVASGAPILASSSGCSCQRADPDSRKLVPPGGCHFDKRTLQCVNVSCSGTCN
jgi:hypothetical protein